MAQVGDALRTARESRGLTLEQVEKVTRIRRVLLQAIEEDRFDQLPADVYTRGFIRNYARVVGLDPEETVAAYAAAVGAPMPGRGPQVLDEPLVQPQGGSPIVGIFWGIVIVLVIAAAGWYAYKRFYLGETPTLPPLPFLAPRGASPGNTPESATLAPQAVVVAPTATDAPTETALPPTPEPTATPVPTERPSATPRVAATAAAVAAATAETDAPLASTPVAGETPAQEGRVTVEATISAATYVEVTADGVRLLTATLQAGDEQTWTAQERVALRVGNAGGIKLKVNGVDVPSLGASGEVVNVEYTAEDLPQG